MLPLLLLPLLLLLTAGGNLELEMTPAASVALAFAPCGGDSGCWVCIMEELCGQDVTGVALHHLHHL